VRRAGTRGINLIELDELVRPGYHDHLIEIISSDFNTINMKAFDPKLLTGAQLRAARALIGISADALAAITKLGVATIRRAEANSGSVSMTLANAERLVRALESAGVEFIPENGGGAGVRLIAVKVHE
jgi:hypothetical protein